MAALAFLGVIYVVAFIMLNGLLMVFCTTRSSWTNHHRRARRPRCRLQGYAWAIPGSCACRSPVPDRGAGGASAGIPMDIGR